MSTEYQPDKKSLRVYKVGNEPKGFIFWQTQPYAARLAALEEIRQSYISWKYGTEQGFQRVYRVVKLS